ncbi:MAG TPA: hypothetical protein VLC98_10355 [Phnomibacter sp.]|nr:hypothetical protein [Phnomibacter sp.]
MNTIDQLIGKLEKLQVGEESKAYRKGMFRSQRFHKYLPYQREDDNIFFSASIAFLLRKNIGLLEDHQREKVNRIIDGVRANYPFYSNLKNEFIYNFYHTRPPKYYPNGYFFSRFKHFKLADDADDTVIVALTLQDVPVERIDTIRKNLVQFSNLQQKKIKGIGEEYASLPFYATWFGTGKMPIELEICVVCNILYFTFSKQLELNEQDKASITLIKMAIDSYDIVTKSFEISGQYPKPSVILYHIARLCSVMPNPAAYFDIEKLEAITRGQLKKSSLMEEIFLSIALWQLGKPAVPVEWSLHAKELKKDFAGFPFFIAPMLSGHSNVLLRYLKKFPLFHIQFRSDAFYYTILLEYELLLKVAANTLA